MKTQECKIREAVGEWVNNLEREGEVVIGTDGSAFGSGAYKFYDSDIEELISKLNELQFVGKNWLDYEFNIDELIER